MGVGPELCGLPRTPLLLGSPVNKGKKEGRGCYAPAPHPLSLLARVAVLAVAREDLVEAPIEGDDVGVLTTLLDIEFREFIF